MATHVITSTTTNTNNANVAMGTTQIVGQCDEGAATTAVGETDLRCFSRLQIYNEGGKHLQSTYTSNNTDTTNIQSTATTADATNQKVERSKKTTRNSTSEHKKYTYLPLVRK